jgi:hypothetical protein
VINAELNDGLSTLLIPAFKQYAYKSIVTSTRVPTASTISITLRTVYSRKNLHDRFDLNKFAKGELLADKDKGYGGFL